MAIIIGLSLQVYVEGVAKTDIGPVNADQERHTRQLNTIVKLLEGPLAGPKPKVAQSFPVTVEDMSHQEN